MAVVKPSDLVPMDLAHSLQSRPRTLVRPPVDIQGGVSPESITDDAARDDAALVLAPGQGRMDRCRRSLVLITAVASVVLAVTLISHYANDPDFTKKTSHTPIDGLTIFAVFFVAAFAIERLLEPLAALLIPKQTRADALATSMDAATKATIDFYGAMAAHPRAAGGQANANDTAGAGESDPQPRSRGESERTGGSPGERADAQHRRSIVGRSQGDEAANTLAAQSATDYMAAKHQHAQNALNAAAAAKAAYQDNEYTRTVAFWAVATVIAMLGSASLHLYFLQAVGMSSSDRSLEILATGLIIGAGTKPLNDLRRNSARRTASHQTPLRCARS